MREIKFRGRSLYDEKQWVYGLVFKSGSEGQWTEIQTANGATCYVDPETIGQYTGLKDCLGTEIYEGDIVEVTLPESRHAEIGAVKWNDKYLLWELHSVGESLGAIINNGYNVEVIAKVY